MAATGGIASALNPGVLNPGSSSIVINGQLVPSFRSGNYYPRSLASAGPGGISTGITNPAFPPQTGGPGFPGASAGSGAGQAAARAGVAPFDIQQSPVLWWIGALVVGFLLLRFVHHGY